eukprot:TRINITY_DN15349_c0_g1_i1.p2 TRINITY_DN15349_c0_g1~~TRINITY_DN15349_c0_g1_i1.p2  ORF type:complete len:355 (+),score=85.34 TRINITY_DN15349_c0_g1_i1:148-1212(+)
MDGATVVGRRMRRPRWRIGDGSAMRVTCVLACAGSVLPLSSAALLGFAPAPAPWFGPPGGAAAPGASPAAAPMPFLGQAPAAAPPPLPPPGLVPPAPAPPTRQQRREEREQRQAARQGGVAQNGSNFSNDSNFTGPSDTLAQEAWDMANPGFDQLDTDPKDGIITVDEAATFALSNGVPWASMKPLFDVIDLDRNHQITRQEYNASRTRARKYLQEISPTFRDLDLDSDGKLHLEEWMLYCNGWMVANLSKATCESLFNAADRFPPKGIVDRREFLNAGRYCHTADDGNCTSLLATMPQGGFGSSSRVAPASLKGLLVLARARAYGIDLERASRRTALRVAPPRTLVGSLVGRG